MCGKADSFVIHYLQPLPWFLKWSSPSSHLLPNFYRVSMYRPATAPLTGGWRDALPCSSNNAFLKGRYWWNTLRGRGALSNRHMPAERNQLMEVRTNGLKGKLNERNANSCLLPRQHRSNSHSYLQSKSPYEADLRRELFKALFLRNQSGGGERHNKPTMKKFVLCRSPWLTRLLERLLI